jgi:endonuclease/exonuclease/phosphatase family metal-dependent hydrolase
VNVIDQLQTGSFVLDTASIAPDTLRVVTWNINRGQQLGGIIAFLAQEPADLILLQEADFNAKRTNYRNIAHEIAQALSMNYVFGCEFQELTQGRQSSPAYTGQATLSRLPLTASRIIRFRSQSEFWRPRWYVPQFQPFQRRLGARMALVSSVNWSERQLMVYNVHLESRGNDSLRSSQLIEILDDSHSFPSDIPVVIAGDFNFGLSGPNGASLIPKVSHAEGTFENPFLNGDLRATTTPPRLGRARAIDWILVRGPVRWTTATLHDRVTASDHFPLSLVLKATWPDAEVPPRSLELTK